MSGAGPGVVGGYRDDGDAGAGDAPGVGVPGAGTVPGIGAGGAAGICGGMNEGAPPLPAERPVDASVPAENSTELTPGRAIWRIRCGVMSSMISVLLRVSLVEENSRPRTGRSPRPGTRLAGRRSSSLISPARTWVSPSRSRSTVVALRVPI